ncbi:MAG: inositol monophosphatase family protein [Planctomycetota bacterium]
MASRPDELDELLDVAVAAAIAGGAKLRRFWNEGVRQRAKAGSVSYDLVSDADLQSQDAVVEVISSRCPDHGILAEEDLAKRLGAEHLWVIDPLDGTNNFAHRVPQFAVSVGYFHCGQPTVGVIHSPISGETFTAIRGRGARRDAQKILASDSASLSESLVGCGFYYDRGDMMRRTLLAIEDFFTEDIHGIRRLGAASLDLCAVALGQFGVFFEYKLSPWDFAAGQLIVSEAGGTITDASGNPLGLVPSSVLATGPLLHEAAKAITSKHHP